MDASGKVHGFAQQEYPIDSPRRHFAEQPPEQWWELACTAIQQALHRAGSKADEVAGIGLSGQMHGLVLVDREGRVLRPAIIWCDQRSVAQQERVAAMFTPEQIGEMLRNPLSVGFQLLSLLWVQEHEPEIYSHIHRILLPKDYVRYRLTGELATEATDASATLAYSPEDRSWSYLLLEALGLDAGMFPEVREPWELAGYVTGPAAEEAGLKPGTPVVYGGADQPMQAIGNGIIAPGTLSCTIGTGGQLFAALREPLYDRKLRTHTYVHAVPGTWYMLGATLSAGLSLRWLAANILGRSDYEALDSAAAAVPPGSEGLLFLPYLNGERTPHMDPLASAMFAGLTLRHRDSHMVRAVLEGVAYSLRDCLGVFRELGIAADRIILSGGGASSALWAQIFADVFGLDVYTNAIQEQACAGAAVMAGVGTGVFSSIAAGCQAVVRIQQQPVSPIAAHMEAYNRGFEQYRQLYANNKHN